MPAYHRLGQIPPKRHTQFRKTDGTLYSEELFGTEGFSGNYANIYYHYPPTRVKKVAPCARVEYEEWHEEVQRHHHLAKVLEKIAFYLVGAPGLEPGTR